MARLTICKTQQGLQAYGSMAQRPATAGELAADVQQRSQQALAAPANMALTSHTLQQQPE